MHLNVLFNWNFLKYIHERNKLQSKRIIGLYVFRKKEGNQLALSNVEENVWICFLHQMNGINAVMSQYLIHSFLFVSF